MPIDPDAPEVLNPAPYIPPAALAFGAIGAEATLVDAAHPLPVRERLTQAASTPLAGTLSASGVAGPFLPELGRPMWLTLSGGWTGSVTLKRSVDGGATKVPLTSGGEASGVFAANACEQIAEETEAGATWYLDFTRSTGTLTYRVAQ